MGATTSPDPGIAGELGSKALSGAIVASVVVPVFQHILWRLLIDIPATSATISQSPHAWLFILLLGLFPPMAVTATMLRAAVEAGLVAAVFYLLMVIVGTSLFGNPVLVVWTIIGLVLILFFYLTGRLVSERSRQSHRRP